MMEWDTELLGDIVTFITNKEDVNNFSLETYISTENLLSDKGGISLAASIPSTGKINTFQNEDVLFSNIRTYFKKVWYASFNGGCSNDVIVFRSKSEKKLNQLFLYYVISSDKFINYTARTAKGTKMPRGDKAAMKQYNVLLPSIDEQKEIAKTLYNFDKKIHLLHQQNKTLEQIAQTLFKQWFVDFEFPNENGQPYKSSGGKMVESELGEIPEGWRVEKLNSNIQVSKGLSYKGVGLSDEGIIMHSLKSILEGGGYRHDGIKYYNAEYKDRHIVRSGDIIVANTEQGEKHMLIGFPARIPSYVEGDSIITHHLTKVVPLESSSFTRQYIYYSLLCNKLRYQIISYTNGTTVNGLPVDGLQEPIWITPTNGGIPLFSRLVNNIWAKQENNYKEIQTLTKLRDTLLPKLMSGAIRVNSESMVNP